jgi:hypothetical protein
MRLVCVQREKLLPLVQVGASIQDLTPDGLWDTTYHVVSMSDEQFEALKKLIDDQSTIQDITPKPLTHQTPAGSGFLYSRGGRIPNGTKLRARHLSREYQAEVKGGKVWIDNRSYDSPSNAAVAVTHSSVNGWKFWEYLDEQTDRWFPLLKLRSKNPV